MLIPYKKSAIAAAIACSFTAHYTQSEETSSETSQVGIEEVLVTAQKREQSLQDVPVAITAINAQAINDRKIEDISDIGSTAPNVQIAPSPGGSTGATVAIRGAASINPAATWEPSVGIYMDGVFISKNVGGIFDVAELSAIEILRGPQGTLYGKNTTGGAINLVTRKPDQDFGAKVKVGAGNYGYTEFGGTIDSGMVNDIASFMLSYTKRDRDGFYENTAPNAKIDEFKKLDSQALLFKASIDATNELNISYIFDFAQRDNTVAFGQLEVLNPATSLDQNSELPAPKRLGKGGLDGAGYDKSDTQGHSVTATYDINDDLVLKSITAYRAMTFNDFNDYDGVIGEYFHTERDIKQHQFSQELQLVGSHNDWNYVAGLFYFKDDVDIKNPYFGNSPARNFYGVESSSFAIFGQADWLITDELTLSFGGRFTQEKKDAYVNHPDDRTIQLAVTNTVSGYTANSSNTWDNFSPMIALSYAINDEITTYAKASQGWRAGGFNGESANQADAEMPYKEEVTTSYELGLKGQSSDNRIQYNLALFRNEIKDMQLSDYDFTTGYSKIENAGEALITGIELEVMLALTDGLIATFSHGYMNAKYLDLLAYDPISEEYYQTKDSATFAYTPESKSALALTYSTDLGFGKLRLNTDYSYTSEQVFYRQYASSKKTKSPAYVLLNARVELADINTTGNQSISVGLWGKNLTAEAYRINGIPATEISGINYYGDPRTFGADVTYNF